MVGLVTAGVADRLWYRCSRKCDGSDGGRRRILNSGAIVAMPLQVGRCASPYALARATLEVAERWTGALEYEVGGRRGLEQGSKGTEQDRKFATDNRFREVDKLRAEPCY